MNSPSQERLKIKKNKNKKAFINIKQNPQDRRRELIKPESQGAGGSALDPRAVLAPLALLPTMRSVGAELGLQIPADLVKQRRNAPASFILLMQVLA